MNNVGKLFIKMGLLSLLSVMPLAAQMDNGVDFTASFPFYAGNAKLPAGNYKVVQPDAMPIYYRSRIETICTRCSSISYQQSLRTSPQSAVTFEKYGDTDYLDRVWIEGQEYGISVDPSRVETAAEANATQHATAAGGQ